MCLRVKGLIRSTTGVILAADYTYTSANNDTNTTDGAFNQTRRNVGDVMEAAVAVIDTVSDALLNFVEVGDPAAEVVTDDVTLRVQRSLASDLDNTAIESAQGSVSLPSVTSLIDGAGDGDCVTSQVNNTHQSGKHIHVLHHMPSR